MPIDPTASQSPERYSRSPSPTGDGPGPYKKARFSAADIQRRQLEKLLANPDKEVTLPTGAVERSIRAPRDMMKSVTGSSSAAGSGEFHVYKAARRREFERMKIMDDKAKALEEQEEFLSRQAARDAVTDAKTAKNRAKRQKRKQGRKGGPGEDGGAPAVAAPPQSKFATGAGAVAFRRPGEEVESDEEEVAPAPVVPAEVAAPVAAGPGAGAVDEVKITVVDED